MEDYVNKNPQTNPGDEKINSTKLPVSKLVLRIIAVIFIGLLLLLIFIYISNSFHKEINKTVNNEPNANKIIKSKKIIIGTDATYPPMEFKDADDKLIGYDIELGNKIAELWNINPEYKNIVWDNLFTALAKDDIDIIISSVTITDERKNSYDFSVPYLNAGQVVITRNDNKDITSISNLKGKIIAVQKGTTNEQEALKYTTSDLVKTFDNFENATGALIKNEVDAIFSDLTNAKGIINNNKSLKIATEPFTSEYYGIVVKQGRPDLVDKINSTLNTLRQQGYLVYLKQKWLD